LHIRKVFFISKLALTVVLGYAAVRTLMILQYPGDAFVPSSASGSENISEPELTNPTDVSVRDYSAIVERNIFGGSGSSLDANESLWDANTGTSLRSAEEELGLLLLGTVSGSPAVARALIKDTKTDKVGLYKTGDAIAAAFIEAIQSDAVTLRYEGQRRVLRLRTTSDPSANSNRLPFSQSTKEAKEAVGAVSPAMQFPNEQREGMGQIEDWLDRAVIAPYKVHDQIEGLRITGLENVPAAEDLGLKNGDVIRSVNGQQLTSKQHAYQVFKKAKTQPSINIELLRSGKTRQLSFALP
jgi:general secretion pathway protein C